MDHCWRLVLTDLRMPRHLNRGDSRTIGTCRCVNIPNVTEVATCLTSAPDLEELRGGGSMKIRLFPDSKVMEFAIGAIQMGTFKSFYLVTLRDIGKGRINL